MGVLKKSKKERNKRIGAFNLGIFTIAYSEDVIEISINHPTIKKEKGWKERFYNGTTFFSKLCIMINNILAPTGEDDWKQACTELDNFCYLRFMSLQYSLSSQEFVKLLADWFNKAVQDAENAPLEEDLSEKELKEFKTAMELNEQIKDDKTDK